MSDFNEFILFFRSYTWSRVLLIGSLFTVIKDFSVNVLIFKRGKYSASIINTSFIFLVFGIVVTAPTIAENNPFKEGDIYSQNTSFDTTSGSLSLEESFISLDTFRSKVRDKVQVYEVVSGDTIGDIAKKFEVSDKSIEWANNLNANSKLTSGTKLKIPPVSGVIHTVAPGDSIYSIAKKYKVSAQNIVNFPFNEFRDSSFNLVAGTVITVPEGVVVKEQSTIPDAYSFAQVVAGVKGTSNFIWPTNGVITQYPTVYHMALDVANPSMPPVLASDSGTVVYSGCFSWGYGCHIIIDHGNGYLTLYGHLSQRDVEQGVAVSQGQQIGLMGSTGRSTGTHLHFEVRSGSELQNPQSFLR